MINLDEKWKPGFLLNFEFLPEQGCSFPVVDSVQEPTSVNYKELNCTLVAISNS